MCCQLSELMGRKEKAVLKDQINAFCLSVYLLIRFASMPDKGLHQGFQLRQPQGKNKSLFCNDELNLSDDHSFRIRYG